MKHTPRLAIVATHPIQYYAPWFAHLTRHLRAEVEVFYLWDFGVAARFDPDFELDVRWDIDLLGGHAHRFVRNHATEPGTHHFLGLRNPSLVRELAEWRPDAVLLFGYRYLSHLQVIHSRRLGRVPLVFRGDSHLLAERPGPHPAKRLGLRLLFRRFAAFLPVGRANADYFRRHGVPEERLFFTPHCVDNDRFSAAANEKAGVAWRRSLGIDDRSRVVLFAGKFERKKRPDLLVRAFLAARLSHADLVLVGHGALETELRRLASGHPNIHFVPFQNQSAMPRVHAAADLFVLPSQGPGESWGLVVNEALCAGCAAIVSDHVGCHTDLVRPGETGMVFRAGDVDALRDALAFALEDDDRLRAWGAAGLRRVKGFSFDAATAGLQQALDFTLATAAR